MLRTITLGTSVTIQGMFVRDYPDGKIAVRDGNTIYTGKPVKTAA
ncbi:hypothetical protein [Arenibacterium halophilum]|jgi:hypothetical protein|nr:hypothetical protein [Arenibacterium halophilum]MEC7258382.1 hypothetical protein [Pseudomonadota bacterium]|tara:strand:- start:608 stop:742 length:135 start_codon:yes stop_codon:yes gene_type:complete